MMKMRKLFLKLSMLLFVLAMSVNAAWGQELKVYFASLKAQTSPASTGSGDVKLTWVDITGKPMEVALAKQLNWAAFSGTDWTNMSSITAGLNTLGQIQNGVEVEGAKADDGPAATAQLIGGTMCAMDGVEVAQEMGNQIYMTSYVYFQAEAEPANGSYLAGWTFTDPAITRIDTAMGNGDDIAFISPCFKVLPDTANNAPFVENEGMPYTYTINLFKTASEVANTPAKVNYHAVFKKYLLSNPQATSGSLEAIAGRKATLNVSFEVEGDITQFKENYADFVFPSYPTPETPFASDENGKWTWEINGAPEVIAPNKVRANIIVTYTALEDITVGKHTTNLQVKIAGGEGASTLNIPLTVDALDPNRPEAFWFDGKTEQTSGTLADMLAADISGYSKPILRLNRPCGELEFSGKNFTLDFNGNNVGHITVASGNVTIAYNSLWGTALSLTVEGGNVTLNGGMFETLTIENGATVTQNGAKVSGFVNNKGVLTTTDGEFNGGLTTSNEFTANGGIFKGTTAITVTGGTAVLNRGTIEGTTYGVQTKGGATTIKKLAAINGGTYSVYGNGGGLTVECGKFSAPLNGSMDFTSGYFKTNNYGVSTEGKTEMQVIYSVEANEGYAYFLGDAESAKANGVGVCRIGDVSYARLEDALDYANNNPSVANIVMLDDERLRASRRQLYASCERNDCRSDE